MKKWLIGSALALAALCGVAVAQVPGLFLTTLTGNEQINVLVPSTGTVVTSPQITTIIASQLRDASGYSLQVPLTGFAITVPANVSVLALNPAGTLAAGAVTLIAAPVDGARVLISSTQTVTALTVSANTGQTLVGAATTVGLGVSVEYLYQLSSKTWFRIQ